jgi:hypothetical protein
MRPAAAGTPGERTSLAEELGVALFEPVTEDVALSVAEADADCVQTSGRADEWADEGMSVRGSKSNGSGPIEKHRFSCLRHASALHAPSPTAQVSGQRPRRVDPAPLHGFDGCTGRAATALARPSVAAEGTALTMLELSEPDADTDDDGVSDAVCIAWMQRGLTGDSKRCLSTAL